MIWLHKHIMLVRIVVAYLIISLFFQIVAPTVTWALTNGPSQPEFESFKPVGMSNMVNTSTGAFSYDINLLDVDGYPISMFYHGNTGMDTDASMVGLGWNLNAGSLSRNMRGLPDEFNGDLVKKELNKKPNTTLGVKAGLGLEFVGLKVKNLKGKLGLNIGGGVNYNNYRGFGWEASISPSLTLAKYVSSEKTISLTPGFSLSVNSLQGVGFDPYLSFRILENKSELTENQAMASNLDVNVGLSASYNSLAGLKALSVNFSGDRDKVTIDLNNTNNSKEIDRSGSGGGPIATFGTPSYSMQPSFPFLNTSFSFRFKTGTADAFFHPHLWIEGYYSENSLLLKQQLRPAYGYFHLEETEDKDNLLMDINREKDGVHFKKGSINLSVPQSTPDFYAINGHGVGGMFRGVRSDRGIFSDDASISGSVDLGIGFDVGASSGAHGGLNGHFSATSMTTGKWKRSNKLKKYFKFKGKDPNDPFYEPYYFQKLGEPVVETDPSYNEKIGGDDPVRVRLNKSLRIVAQNNFEKNSGALVNGSNGIENYHREKRAIRNTHISSLTSEEAQHIGLEKEINSYSFATDPTTGESTGELILNNTNDNDRVSSVRKEHHQSTFTVLADGGSRYMYEIPAYNTYQKDVAFNASGLTTAACLAKGVVSYNLPGQSIDNSTNNSRGVDNYFSSTELPPYAHSYLLTGVLSSDYVDVGQDGITDDDLGTAYKINYNRDQSDFHWRVPFEENTASFNPGFKNKKNDDKASYSYGTKEIWYIRSIVGPHSVAEFYYNDLNEPRKDGYGVKGENGGIDLTKPLRKLEKIVLYAKKDRKENKENATPIKTVHFGHSYDLCKKIPNSSTYNTTKEGKLTLDYIYFTYGNSNLGKFHPYEFTYADMDHDGVIDLALNPDYDMKAYDRWGTYKPNSCSNMPNWEDPYTDQRVIPSTDNLYDPNYPNRRYADIYAQAFKLSSIKTPSGAEIMIDYESNDYAYVEDKRAMQMTKIKGIGPDSDVNNIDPTNSLYKKLNGNNYQNNNYIFIDLNSTVNSVEEFKEQYLDFDTDPIYFNFYIDVTGKGAYEQVVGYLKIEEVGLANSTTGWIKIEELHTKDDGKGKAVPAISRKAWDFVRMSMPEFIFTAVPPAFAPNTTKKDAKKLFGNREDIKKHFFKGFNQRFRSNGYGKLFDIEKSWLRLTSPDKYKHGGGVRVKQIYTSDNWGSIVPGQSNSFGQVYDYSKMEDGKKISSGVASYEPMLGGDEIPHRVPREYSKKNKWALNDLFYWEEPFGEFFYPSAQIVYEEVKVYSLPKAGVSKNATGFMKYEYYSAKDFPVIPKETAMIPENRKPIPVLSFFNIKLNDFANATQGYSVELNDMHGRPKAQWTYGEHDDKNYISGVEYKYRTKIKGGKRILDNEDVLVIYDDNTTGNETIGKEIDFTVDARQHVTKTGGLSTSGNLDLLSYFFPLPSITAYPKPIISHSRARLISTSKVIRKYGLLDKVIAHNGGASISTQNVAYDAETGGVLITQTSNEYKDPVYSFSYPAHWAYEKMGQSYQNMSLGWEDKKIPDLDAYGTDPSKPYFMKGDELFLLDDQNSINERAWVLDVSISNNEISVVDKEGQLINPSIEFDKIIIIRSGYKNLQSTSIGAIASKSDPLANGLDNFDEVLAASAVKLKEEWQTFSGFPDTDFGCSTCTDPTPEAQDFEDMLNYLLDNNTSIIDNTAGISTYLPGTTLASGIFSLSTAGCEKYKSVGMSSVTNCTNLGLTIDLGEECSGNSNFNSLANINLTANDPNNPYCIEFFDEFSGIRAVNFISGECGDTYEFEIDGIIFMECEDNNGNSFVKVPFTGLVTTNNIPIRSCPPIYSITNSCETEGDIVNPFLYGIRGNWNAEKSFTYLTGRGPTTPNPQDPTNIRTSGTMHNFSSFWKYSGGEWVSDENGWQWTAEVTKRIPEGFDVENVDPLGRYSSVQYGYNNRLPVTVAANARQNNIAYANFESEDDLDETSCTAHFLFDKNHPAFLEPNQAHSGYKSAKIIPGEKLAIKTGFSDGNVAPGTNPVPYILQEIDCITGFRPELNTDPSPEVNNKYLVSFWVKSATYDNGSPVFDYANAGLVVKADLLTLIPISTRKSKIIEGWQQVEYIYDIPKSSANLLEIEFHNNGISDNLYFDDIRVHPFDSHLETYVYDPINQWLLASGDANGFFKFYNYDHSGKLTGVRQETAEGIISLETHRSFVKPRALN